MPDGSAKTERQVEAADPVSLYLENERLVYYVWHRMKSAFPQSEWEDAEAEARVGLWKACLAYDPARGVQFSGFAYRVIQNEVLRYRKLHVAKRAGWTFTSIYNAMEKDGESERRSDTFLAAPDDVAEQALGQALVDEAGSLVSLHYLGGYTLGELGRAVGVSRQTIHNRIRATRERLGLTERVTTNE